MNILFDLRIAQTQANRGIGKYEDAIASALLKKDISLSFLISNKLPFPDFINKYNKVRKVYTLENFDEYFIEEAFDFFFSGSYVLFNRMCDPYLKLIDTVFPPNILKCCKRKVGIFYDLIPFIYPCVFAPTEDAKRIQSIVFETYQFADHFFAISEFSKKQFMDFFNRPEKDVTVIHSGYDYKYIEEHVKYKNYNPQERFSIVDISGDAPSKNYKTLAHAFAKAYKDKKIPRQAKLYFICACSEAYKKAIKDIVNEYGLTLGKEVIVTNFIPYDELISIVNASRALIHPSYIEGSGGMALEAAACNVPGFIAGKELAKDYCPQDALYNPTFEGVYDTIVRVYNDDDFCRRTYQFQKKLMKLYTPANAVDAILKKLNELMKVNKPKKTAIFLAGSGAIAEYTVRVHANLANKFDIFADVSNFKELEHLRSLHKNARYCVFPLENYEDARMLIDYNNEIYVLGHSPHHKKIFDLACQSRGRENRYLIVHEPFLLGAFIHIFEGSTQRIVEFIAKWYPTKEKFSGKYKDFYQYCRSNSVYFVRAILEMTGIKNIICYSEKNKEVFTSELCDDELKSIAVEAIPLPFDKQECQTTSALVKRKDNTAIIGCFGIPNDFFKRTCDIIEAVNLLNTKYKTKVRLVLAGLNLAEYAKTHHSPYVDFLCDVSFDEWLSVLNSVDIGIQLRENAFSFSSATVAELLSLKKTMIVTAGMVDSAFDSIVTSIPEGLDANQIALAIKDVLNKRKTKKQLPDSIFEKYSFKHNAEIIYKILQKDC